MYRVLHLVYGVAIVGLLSAGAASAQDGVANGDTSKKRIALTDGFSSNAWEQSAWNSWKAVADQAVKDGVIAEQKIITGNDDPAQQITQLQNLVLEGYNAIVIDAASPTALNGGIKDACDAGIIVVVYDFACDRTLRDQAQRRLPRLWRPRDRIHGEEARWEG